MSRSVVDRLHLEFHQKDSILTEYGTWVNNQDFYDYVFEGAPAESRVMVVEAGNRFVAMRREDALDFSIGRSDVYISAVHFYDDYKNDDFIDYIYAFVIDLDNLSPKWLSDILEGIVERGTAPLPTLVVNSGKGVHFYYVLDEPLYVYPTVRKKARELYAMLNEMFEFTPDKHSIGHPFRPVGSLTKIGDVASGYILGDRWNIVDLADAIGYNWYVPDMDSKKGKPATDKMIRYAKKLAEIHGVAEPNYENFVETHGFIKSLTTKRGSTIKKSGGNESPGQYDTDVEPNGSPIWYSRTRDKIIEKTELEHRYKSLMALAVIAYKCKIPYDKLERDVEHIVQLWLLDRRWIKDPFNTKNVAAAMRCYSSKFVRVRRATLEEWLGWKFTGEKKDSKYTQEEWLEQLADRKSAASLRAIRNVLKEEPTLSKSEIARRTGLSRQTVYNHYNAAMTYIKKK